MGKDYSADSYHPFALSLTEANAKNDYRLGNNVCVNAGREEMEGPEVELKDVENAYLNINQAINYIKDRDLTKECEVLICQNYTNEYRKLL